MKYLNDKKNYYLNDFLKYQEEKKELSKNCKI